MPAQNSLLGVIGFFGCQRVPLRAIKVKHCRSQNDAGLLGVCSWETQ